MTNTKTEDGVANSILSYLDNAKKGYGEVEVEYEVDSAITILEKVIIARSKLGMVQYGISLADQPSTDPKQWLVEAREEAIDLAHYLQKALDVGLPEVIQEDAHNMIISAVSDSLVLTIMIFGILIIYYKKI